MWCGISTWPKNQRKRRRKTGSLLPSIAGTVHRGSAASRCDRAVHENSADLDAASSHYLRVFGERLSWNMNPSRSTWCIPRETSSSAIFSRRSTRKRDMLGTYYTRRLGFPASRRWTQLSARIRCAPNACAGPTRSRRRNYARAPGRESAAPRSAQKLRWNGPDPARSGLGQRRSGLPATSIGAVARPGSRGGGQRRGLAGRCLRLRRRLPRFVSRRERTQGLKCFLRPAHRLLANGPAACSRRKNSAVARVGADAGWHARFAGAKLERKREELALADVVICPSLFVLESLPTSDPRRSKPCVVAEFGSPARNEPNAATPFRLQPVRRSCAFCSPAH